MRRLVLVVVSLAALGIGVVALSSSGHARAAVTRPQAAPATLRAVPAIPLPLAPYIVPSARPRGRIVTRRAEPAPLASPTCFVGAGGCSIHPCDQFAGSSAATAVSSTTVYRIAPIAPQARQSKPTCLPQARRVSEAAATVITGTVSAPAVLATAPKLKP